jgi:hypothetical protein
LDIIHVFCLPGLVVVSPVVFQVCEGLKTNAFGEWAGVFINRVRGYDQVASITNSPPRRAAEH